MTSVPPHRFRLSAEKVVICHAPADRALACELEEQLAQLERQGTIELWHEGRAPAGSHVEAEVQRRMEEAHILVALLSASFLASAPGEAQAHRAIARRQSEGVKLIPVLARPMDVAASLFAGLQLLPRDGEAVSLRKDRHEAWAEVAKAVRAALPASPRESAARSSIPSGIARKLTVAVVALGLFAGALVGVYRLTSPSQVRPLRSDLGVAVDLARPDLAPPPEPVPAPGPTPGPVKNITTNDPKRPPLLPCMACPKSADKAEEDCLRAVLLKRDTAECHLRLAECFAQRDPGGFSGHILDQLKQVPMTPKIKLRVLDICRRMQDKGIELPREICGPI